MSFTSKTIISFLTKEECNTILDFSFNNLKLIPAEIINNTTDGVDNNIRKSNIVFYPYYKKFPFLLEKITKVLNENIGIKGFDLDYEHSEFQFTEYNIGDFFNWHKDVYGDEITEFNRYCSVVIQLNTNYEGGDLEIKTSTGGLLDFGEISKVEKGSGNLIIFLSDMYHRVTDVTAGNRYTLVNWVGLKKQNNYKKTLL